MGLDADDVPTEDEQVDVMADLSFDVPNVTALLNLVADREVFQRLHDHAVWNLARYPTVLTALRNEAERRGLCPQSSPPSVPAAVPPANAESSTSRPPEALAVPRGLLVVDEQAPAPLRQAASQVGANIKRVGTFHADGTRHRLVAAGTNQADLIKTWEVIGSVPELADNLIRTLVQLSPVMGGTVPPSVLTSAGLLDARLLMTDLGTADGVSTADSAAPTCMPLAATHGIDGIIKLLAEVGKRCKGGRAAVTELLTESFAGARGGRSTTTCLMDQLLGLLEQAVAAHDAAAHPLPLGYTASECVDALRVVVRELVFRVPAQQAQGDAAEGAEGAGGAAGAGGAVGPRGGAAGVDEHDREEVCACVCLCVCLPHSLSVHVTCAYARAWVCVCVCDFVC